MLRCRLNQFFNLRSNSNLSHLFCNWTKSIWSFFNWSFVTSGLKLCPKTKSHAEIVCLCFAFVEQFCNSPPEIANATMHITGSFILMANHSFVNYKCNEGFAHGNGSLNGTCQCTNTSEGRCVSKPEWHFDGKQPFCTGMYLILH